MNLRTRKGLLAAVVILAQPYAVAEAQVVIGEAGSPSATTTIDGRQLPPAPGNFGGVINLDAPSSTSYWQPQVAPPKGARNVLLIITDDVGFGAPSTFGGVIPTPNGAPLHAVCFTGKLHSVTVQLEPRR